MLSLFRRLRLAIFVALAALCFPSQVVAQDAPAPTGSQGCGTFDFSCQIFGNPQNLKGNVQQAETLVKGLGCWSCTIFNKFGDVVFAQGSSVASKADSALKPVIVAVATLFALFYMGSAFVSGDGSDLLSRWKVFWRLCIAVAVGTAWMSGSGSFNNTWNYIYSPLLSIPLAVEQSVGGGSPGGSGCEAHAPANPPPGANSVMSEMASIVCGANDISLKGIAVGLGLAFTGDGLIGSLINMGFGIAVMVIFAWITISFPMRFIDVLLRLAVVGIVTPVLVVCAVFKPTRSYVQLGIKNVLYAGCLFAFTGIMFKLGNSFMTSMVENTDGTSGPQTQLVRGIVLLGSGVIFSAMVKMAVPLAAEFSSFSGSSGGVGDAATGFASTVVTMPVKMAGVAAGGVGASMAMKSVAGAAGAAGGAAGAAAATSGGLAAGVTK